MKKASPDSESYLDRIRSWARTKAHGPSPLSSESNRSPVLPIRNPDSNSKSSAGKNGNDDISILPSRAAHTTAGTVSKPTSNNAVDNISSGSPPPAPPPEDEGQGPVLEKTEYQKKGVAARFYLTLKAILFSSWINVLLIFVPIGIAADVAKLKPIIVFVMNAIAIVPLAGLLSHATESVAKRMGDTVGALMNVTFGNAVELIIFIALSKDEIRIVQASLLGSILSNLLLILGMCFLFGGLRFREQIYNSTVTQMSACLLSLSVISLLLPTAFHASFNNEGNADNKVLKVSRGTSVVLLLVYVLYLLFQLKSHAYMYESTPQHILDEEYAPGPVAAWMDSSSSDDSSSSSSDSDNSRGSNTTAGRIKRVMRGGRKHRKSSNGSKDNEPPVVAKSPSYSPSNASPVLSDILSEEPKYAPNASASAHRFGAIDVNDDADDEVASPLRSRAHSISDRKSRKNEKKQKKREKKERKKRAHERHNEKISEPIAEAPGDGENEPKRVDFANLPDAQTDVPAVDGQVADATKRPFAIRGISIRPVIPKTFSQGVFASAPPPGSPQAPRESSPAVTGPIPRVRYGIRRTNSLPDRLNQVPSGPNPPQRAPSTALQPAPTNPLLPHASEVQEEENISRTTAVVLLLASTGLVALCAEFMVSAISSVVLDTPLGETFVGLIILPIVGNAAEHVTAVSVAHKNKMDLAIGVAVGSSIQIALFVTPFIVLLGWAMNKEMSLYFTLFETVSLFVAVFVVNFLVLDGRSNYLEGALLCSAYVIIAVAAYFYPGVGDASSLGGNPNTGTKLIRSLIEVAGPQIGVTV